MGGIRPVPVTTPTGAGLALGRGDLVGPDAEGRSPLRRIRRATATDVRYAAGFEPATTLGITPSPERSERYLGLDRARSGVTAGPSVQAG